MTESKFQIGDKVVPESGKMKEKVCFIKEIDFQFKEPIYELDPVRGGYGGYSEESNLRLFPETCGICGGKKVYSTRRMEWWCPFDHEKV